MHQTWQCTSCCMCDITGKCHL